MNRELIAVIDEIGRELEAEAARTIADETDCALDDVRALADHNATVLDQCLRVFAVDLVVAAAAATAAAAAVVLVAPASLLRS